MQLMAPMPMKALRQARNASPSSERRTPGAVAINHGLFKEGCASTNLEHFPAERNPACCNKMPCFNFNNAWSLPTFTAIVQLSHVNLNVFRPARPLAPEGWEYAKTPPATAAAGTLKGSGQHPLRLSGCRWQGAGN